MSQTQGKPRTVEALEDLLKDLGVEEQEQGVVQLLLEYAHMFSRVLLQNATVASDMAGNSVITASDVRIARTLSEHVIEKMPNSLLNIIEEVNSRKLNAQKSSSPMPAEGVSMVEPNYCVKPNSFDNRFMAKVVFVLGPPGCGKGTQCRKIVENYGLVHLSAGDLLRAEQNRPDSPYSKLIEQHIKEGTIVPVEVTCKLIEKAMNDNSEAPGFLIDGFPRNKNNLDGWCETLAAHTKLQFVLYLECSMDVCIKRCLSRNQGRDDDNDESLKKRIKTYQESSMPIIQHFATLNLVRKVDSSKDPEQIFQQIEEIFYKDGSFKRKL
ncbi:UMP-CMP kinase family protein [Trichinella nativa]|uniref:UMP-CMP kinase n=1 Tax=Trichinella nativa TaxID=6335 RepID=A0A1Y3EAB8_9BILA|nr:UMP-CMP kinase family protein [Trichinella nativa]